MYAREPYARTGYAATAAAAATTVAAALAETLDNITLAGTAAPIDAATLGETIANVTLTGTAAAIVAATLGETVAAVSLAGSAVTVGGAITAALAVTIEPIVSLATGDPPAPLYADVRGMLYRWAPGVVPDRDIDDALNAAYAANGYQPLTEGQVLAAVLPLIPEGNPFEYTAGAPPAFGTPIPGATPVLPPLLPPQPSVAVPVSGGSNPRLGVVYTFAKGLPRFADSNPDPLDGWSLEWDEADGPGAR